MNPVDQQNYPTESPVSLDQPETAFQQLDSNFMISEMVSGLIAIGVVVLVAGVASVVLWLFKGFGWLNVAVLAAATILILLLAFTSFVWQKFYFRHARWKLDEESLEIHRGVLWKHHIAVPLGRVQHADVSQGPLQRRFGLGKLIVHTAGTYEASVELDGLSHDLALQLRDQLIRQTHQL